MSSRAGIRISAAVFFPESRFLVSFFLRALPPCFLRAREKKREEEKERIGRCKGVSSCKNTNQRRCFGGRERVIACRGWRGDDKEGTNDDGGAIS